MIRLVNGRGQLGTALGARLPGWEHPGDIHLLHSWVFMDKSEVVQAGEYNKFKRDLAGSSGKPVFVSTKTTIDSPYLRWKIKAEADTLEAGGVVVRIPNLIGKGICSRFRAEDAKPFGKLELATIEDAAEFTLKAAAAPPGTIMTMEGETLTAALAYNLIKYGRDGAL